MTDFRRRNMGLMVGDRRDYYTRLVEAQTALDGATLELKESENSRDAIRKQLDGGTELPSLLGDENRRRGSFRDRHAHPGARGEARRPAGSTTRRAPDIVAIERIISLLKSRRRRSPSGSPPVAMQVRDPIRQQLSVSLARPKQAWRP